MTTRDIAIELEHNVARERWLVVKTILAPLDPWEREMAVQILEYESKRISPAQFANIKALIEADEFETLVPQ